MKKAKFLKLLFLIIFLELAFPFTVFANTIEQDSKECDRLIAKGTEARNAQNYIKALELYTKAEMLAEERKFKDKLYDTKLGIGIVYQSLSNYGEALGYYRQALNLIEKSGAKDKLAKIYNNIGLLYHYEKDYKNAIVYYNKAYAFDGYTKYCIAVNIADAYNNLGNYKEGRKYLLEVKNMPAELYLVQMWKINFAEGLFLEGSIDKAQVIVEKQLTDAEINCYYCAIELLVRIYTAQGKMEKAIYFAKKGLQNEEVLLERSKLYNHLSKLYLKKKDFETSILYKDSVMQTKDSMTSRINRGLYESNKVKLKVQEYQNEIKVGNEKRGIERKFFIAIFICGIVVVASIYIGFRNKIIKQNQRRVIAENQQKIVELELIQEKTEYLLLKRKMEVLENKSKLEQEQLKNKVDKKNRMLSASALYHSGRNELLEKIISSLTEIASVSKDKDISNYIRELKGHLKADTKWKDFVDHFEKVNPGFLKKIKEAHPQLTQKDIRFLCYLYMNLSTKEICDIFNITPTAFWKRKQRLSEKMNLEKGELYDYILSLA